MSWRQYGIAALCYGSLLGSLLKDPRALCQKTTCHRRGGGPPRVDGSSCREDESAVHASMDHGEGQNAERDPFGPMRAPWTERWSVEGVRGRWSRLRAGRRY